MVAQVLDKAVVMAFLVAAGGGLGGCGSDTVSSGDASSDSGPTYGEAIGLAGDVTRGAALFVTSCVQCHGDEGKIGVANPGSDDTEVPSLNPIDPELISTDALVFAKALDLYLEHGAVPEGSNPKLTMPAYGDSKTLTSQQIADLIAYVISLNPEGGGRAQR